MNMQQVVQPRPSNGYGRRKFERDAASKFDNKVQTGKPNPSRTSLGKVGGLESPSRDRLIYLTTCLIGQQVEVQVQDGSIISGFFHATNADDFGIVLKMARVIKEGSRGQKNVSDTPSKPPALTFIVPAKDLVQVIAKGVIVTRDGLTNDDQSEKQQELMTDSCISQSRHVELGRELEPWIPDESDPSCPELENIFDDHWNRGWDQFEANATLFGVKSTFNEELYTTKLERGPQMRNLEREATRLAREIEGEDTVDLHLAEERGIQLDDNLEMDEETRFSSVRRTVDDSGYDEIENILLDSRNNETFGGVTTSVIGKPPIGLSTGKISDGAQASLRSSFMGEMHSSQTARSRDAYHSGSEDHSPKLLTEQLSKQSVNDESRVHDNQSVGHAESSCSKEDKENLVLHLSRASETEAAFFPSFEDSDSLTRLKKESSDKAVLSSNATSFDPSHASSKGHEKASSSNELPESAMPPKPQGIASSLARPGSSASSTSERGGPTSTSAGRGLSSSSSVGSFTSEKSTLNPHAKEFKFNPNAKSFVPSPTPLRPSSPVADSPFYYPANVASVTQMHGMPVGIGMGPSFAPQQPVIFNPQAAQMPQPYYHPNGPQYVQQMMLGQPRPVLYMPTYPTKWRTREEIFDKGVQQPSSGNPTCPLQQIC
ncbi:Polyadenylate-binding protein-interacting protein 3 [Castilleja foliolosa]|uniref:Polyadenylate-binding protein-interacting protein 3 n=1 Tax=Castilleja foliolosa TaxID=1961234 RepID=A0ABD3BLB4_9LAMI